MGVIVRPGDGIAREGRRVRRVVHAVLTRPWMLVERGPFKGMTRRAGQAVCGARGPFDPWPRDCPAPEVTCTVCYLTCRGEGIRVWEAERSVIVLVGCGARKLDRAAPARELYVGSYFRACLAAAEAVAPPGQVFILSAKHGLIRPCDAVEPYDVTLGQEGAVSAVFVRWQAAVQFDIAAWPVVALCGARYAALAREVWAVVEAPLAGLGIGRQLHVLAGITTSRKLVGTVDT